MAEKNFPDKNVDNDVSSMPSNLRERAKEILGEDLVSMPTAAEIQFIVLMNEYDKVCKEVMHISKTKAKEVAHTQSPLITGTQHRSDNQIIAEKSTSDAPINENLASCASQIEDFRRCSLLASKKNTDLLELIRKSDIVISQLYHDKKELLAQLRNGEPEDCVSDNDDCRETTVETDTTVQSEREYENDELGSEMMQRLIYLETWKANAMVKIDNQLTSLNSTVSKTAHVEALRDVDDLRRDNTLLLDKLAVATTSLLKYREIFNSLGGSLDGVAVDLHKETTSMLPSNATLNDRIKALSVSCQSSVFFFSCTMN